MKQCFDQRCGYKNKARAFIGLDVRKLEAEKKTFMEQIVPEWEDFRLNIEYLSGSIHRTQKG